MDILTQSLTGVKKVFGLLTKTSLLILLVLITCTCSGPRLTLGTQTLENQTDCSIFFGKLAKQTDEAMACATLRTEDRAFLSWPQERPLTKAQYLRMLDLAYCPSLDPMQRRCLQTKLFRYRLTIHSSLNQYRTEWTARKQSLRTEYQPQSLQGGNSIQTRNSRKLQVSTQRSTGKTPGTTLTMEKN